MIGGDELRVRLDGRSESVNSGKLSYFLSYFLSSCSVRAPIALIFRSGLQSFLRRRDSDPREVPEKGALCESSVPKSISSIVAFSARCCRRPKRSSQKRQSVKVVAKMSLTASDAILVKQLNRNGFVELRPWGTKRGRAWLLAAARCNVQMKC